MPHPRGTQVAERFDEDGNGVSHMLWPSQSPDLSLLNTCET